MPKVARREHLTQPLSDSGSSNKKVYIVVFLVAILAGVGTAYFLVNSSPSSSTPIDSLGKATEAPKSAAQDTGTFKDTAVGTLKKKPDTKAAAKTDGTHILVLENGQQAALTSSVVNLDDYDGKKVKVYGQSQKSQTAAWLMDVGKVEVQ